ncbi:hypothetical protein ACFL1G_04040 [Planctomycetota bacterium]
MSKKKALANFIWSLFEVETKNRLGIYLRTNTAVGVCLCAQEHGYSVVDSFSVSIEEQQEQNHRNLINLIAQTCVERNVQFSEVCVALDCSMFMQHNIQSEFDDPKQIAQTIRFDTEEALATDVSDIAIAFFKINSTDKTGSELAVYTAKRRLLANVITALQSNKMDPVTIEPDVHCLWRFLSQKLAPSEDSHPLFAMLSKYSAYFIMPGSPDHSEQSARRTFLLSPEQNRTEILKREVPVTAAFMKSRDPVNCLKVCDSTDSLDFNQLNESLTIQTESVDLPGAANTEPEKLEDCDDQVGFAIAYGAASALSEKTQTVNFRSDFMPYQGKKLRLQKALKFLSICLVVLFVAVGVNVQMQWFQKNKPLTRLQDEFDKQYSAIMFGKKPPRNTDPAKELASEIRRIKSVKNGRLSVTGEESISTKLMLILTAFNKCAAQTNLGIDSITITGRNITIAGNTSDRSNTVKLRQALEDINLKILKDSVELKGGQDNFRISVELES